MIFYEGIDRQIYADKECTKEIAKGFKDNDVLMLRYMPFTVYDESIGLCYSVLKSLFMNCKWWNIYINDNKDLVLYNEDMGEENFYFLKDLKITLDN